MAIQPFRCTHCGQRCGPHGHLAWTTETRPVCSLAPKVRHVQRLGDERNETGFGFCCPPDHICLTTTKQTGWRIDPPTEKQLQYLYVLGYRGAEPLTKGAAHDLLAALVDAGTTGRAEAGFERGIVIEPE